MRILDSEFIKKEEISLLTAMNASFDSMDIQASIEDKHNIELTSTTILKDSDIVVYDDDVAFKFCFGTTATFSVMINRDGSFVGFTEDNQNDNTENEIEPTEQIFKADHLRGSTKQLTQTIAEELNHDQLRTLIEEEHDLTVNKKIAFKTGGFAILDDRVVYIIKFEAQLNFDLLINKDGQFLSLTTATDSDREFE